MYNLHPSELGRLAQLEMAERHQHAERYRLGQIARRHGKATRR